MKCWVCHRQARGYRHSDLRFRTGDPRHHPLDWVFCSRRCQDAFHALYGVWNKTEPPLGDTLTREALMIDATELERAAMHRCLRHFGEAAGEIGFDKPLVEQLNAAMPVLACDLGAHDAGGDGDDRVAQDHDGGGDGLAQGAG